MQHSVGAGLQAALLAKGRSHRQCKLLFYSKVRPPAIPGDKSEGRVSGCLGPEFEGPGATQSARDQS